jgi:hypothetical protein
MSRGVPSIKRGITHGKMFLLWPAFSCGKNLVEGGVE